MKEIPDFLREFASTELARLTAALPPTAEEKFIVFLEIQRTLDVWCVEHTSGKKDKIPNHQFDILRWGMNLATSHLLARQTTPLGPPLVRTSAELRTMATNILWNFGVIALTRRTADMVQHGFLIAQHDGEVLSLRDSGTGPIQFMDHVEIDAWHRAEAEWTKEPVSPQGWAIVEPENCDDNLSAPGAFWARPEKCPSPLYTPDELEELMVPLIQPWKIPQGNMMGYGAAPEVDEHFFLEALLIMEDFHDAAGIHPSANFGEFSGVDLLEVTTLLLSILRKHVAFGLLARKHFPEISSTESFTIWTPKDDLVNSICEVTGHSRGKVNAIMKAFTVTPEDLPRLAGESTPLLPMLIDLGNGLLLRPISSLLRNPLSTFQTVSQWRNTSTRNAISASREAWFRSEIYSVFGGARYSCIPGNIVLRKAGKRLTDIDGAVFDRTNGELALFQLKWQDYSTNDIRELRSKTSNLASEVDSWADRVLEWIEVNPPKDVAQALRLKLKGSQRITSVFLFAVSRSLSRTHGYGFPVSSPYVSIASWPQFRRIRAQVGPDPQVISKMHEVHRAEERLVLTNVTPHAVTVDLPGLRMHFENLWNVINDPENPEPD
jgi:hypothetical protein